MEHAPSEQPPRVTGGHGLTLPAIGYGTYRIKGAAGVEAVAGALEDGYRLVDSAFSYENEGTVGRAVRESGVPRDEVIVTSKLPGRRHRYERALETVEESVYRTGLDRIDLYLVHWPNPGAGRYVEAWRALIEARERGLVRHIGVSNFLPEHIDRLVAQTGVTPAVNQVELHPYFPQAEQRAYDLANGIITQAWSPLGRAGDLLRDPVLVDIAHAHGVGTGQAVLRWHLQLGVVPLPKAESPERRRANLAVLDWSLTDTEMARIAALARPDGRLSGQDPAVYEEF